eukprot:scaffold436_cov267-Pinguiococcus_pyrenoidosus.AAC.25
MHEEQNRPPQNSELRTPNSEIRRKSNEVLHVLFQGGLGLTLRRKAAYQKKLRRWASLKKRCSEKGPKPMRTYRHANAQQWIRSSEWSSG